MAGLWREDGTIKVWNLGRKRYSEAGGATDWGDWRKMSSWWRLQRQRRKARGCAEIGDSIILIHSGVPTSSTAKAGVAFLVHEDTLDWPVIFRVDSWTKRDQLRHPLKPSYPVCWITPRFRERDSLVKLEGTFFLLKELNFMPNMHTEILLSVRAVPVLFQEWSFFFIYRKWFFIY